MNENINKAIVNGRAVAVHIMDKKLKEDAKRIPVLITVYTYERYQDKNKEWQTRNTLLPVATFVDKDKIEPFKQLAADIEANKKLKGNEEENAERKNTNIGFETGKVTTFKDFGTRIEVAPEDIAFGVALKEAEVRNRAELNGVISGIIYINDISLSANVKTEVDGKTNYNPVTIYQKRQPEVYKAIVDATEKNAEDKPVLKEGATVEIECKAQLHGSDYKPKDAEGNEVKTYKGMELTVSSAKVNVVLAKKEAKKEGAKQTKPRTRKPKAPKVG